MASEADSSLLTDTLDSIESSSTQKDKSLRSPIHQYSRPPNDNEPKLDGKGRKIIYCSKCSYGASATTNLRNHLKSKHQIVLVVSDSSTKVAAREKLKQLYDEASAENSTAKFDSYVLKKVLNKDVIEQALLNLIIMRNLPLRAVQELHVLCQALNPESRSYIPASYTTVAKMIDNSFQSQMDIVRKRLQSALTSIHLAVDIWTSPNNYLLLAICAHFINDQGERTKALLALRTVAGHGGEDQWDALLPVLENFGIVRKLGAIIADNSGTNDSLCRTISQCLLEKENIEWDPTRQRIRCQGHIINLAVLAFLFQDVIDIKQIESYEEDEESGKELSEKEKKEKQDSFRRMGVLGKLHNIVVHIRSSAARTKLFVSYAGRKIPLDNRTRWNSWFYMLIVALEYRSAVDKYVEEYLLTLPKDSLTPQDWQLLRMISEFLAPFEKATRKLQGDDATLDQVLPIMNILIEHMDRALKLHRSNKAFASRITCCWEKFDWYYMETDRSPLYAAALILHPKRRTNYIKRCWPEKWQKSTLLSVKKLWENYRDKHPISTLYEMEHEPEAQEGQLDLFDRIERDIDNKYTRPASQDEYEDYCSGEPYDPKVSAIQWWAQEQQQKRWPRLSVFAFEVLSIPAMSDEPERVFSSGRRTISWDRMQLGAETVEKIECLKSWYRSGVSGRGVGLCIA